MHDPDPVYAGLFSSGKDVNWSLWRVVQTLFSCI